MLAQLQLAHFSNPPTSPTHWALQAAASAAAARCTAALATTGGRPCIDYEKPIWPILVTAAQQVNHLLSMECSSAWGVCVMLVLLLLLLLC